MNHDRVRSVHVAIVGALINILLSLGKVVAGVLAASGALVADGIHSLSDLVTDGVVLVGMRVADLPEDQGHAFGHGRYETISAFLVGAVLVSAGVLVARDAVVQGRDILAGASVAVPARWAAGVAAGAVLVKEWLFRITRREGRRTGSPALLANAWHHRSDALSSVAAFLGIMGASLLGPRGRLLDPIAAAVVALMIVGVGGRTVFFAVREMSDASLPVEDCASLLELARSVPGVQDPHGLRTRRLGRTIAVELHIRVDGEISVNEAHEMASRVEGAIRGAYGPSSRVITHVEPLHNGSPAHNERSIM